MHAGLSLNFICHHTYKIKHKVYLLSPQQVNKNLVGKWVVDHFLQREGNNLDILYFTLVQHLKLIPNLFRLTNKLRKIPLIN
jgi:hypothetical protein